MESTTSTVSGSITGQDDNTPLQKYVIDLKKLTKVEGNHKVGGNKDGVDLFVNDWPDIKL